VLTSCSKTKYSGFRQSTSNFISYYNTYFNIKQLYKVGYRESIAEKQETTSDIISIFEYENDPQYFESTAQFKATTVKVNKLLNLRPYTKWVDDAVLIEGKIRYLKGDLDSSIQLLSYLVEYYPKGYIAGHLPGGKLKGFDDKVRQAVRKKEPIHQAKFKYKFARNEGIIWLAKAFIKKGSLDRAQNLIYMAEADMGFPVEYRKDLLKVKVMMSLAKKDFVKTNEYLNILLEEYKLSNREKGRVYFIMGQLNEQDKKYNLASNNFEKALSYKLKNDLEFEAKLRMLAYSSGGNSLAELKKMLNKGKYQQNIDKVYFAIGNVLMEKKEKDEALDAYKKAIANSKNSNQKFIVYEKIASIFYEEPNYVLAAQYYDSAQRVIPQNYPDKKEFLKKVEALNRLLVQYNIYISKDSILELAGLGPEKAKAKIEKEIKKAYESEKAKEIFLESKTLNSQSVSSTPMAGSQNRQWYFSNKENVDKGRISFQKKWGKLLLKDNWHRAAGGGENSNIASNNTAAADNLDMNDVSTDLVAEVVSRNLPFSKEAKKPIRKEIQQALINMARIYNYEIKDINKAIETYELLFEKYGEEIENEDEHLFSLFRLYLEKEDADAAEKTKSDLIAKYPNSKYALYALNPNAKSEDEKSDLAVARQYKEAYSKYQKTFYTEAMDMCNGIIEQYPNHKLVPKVKLLQAFIYSYSYNPEAYVKTLEDIINQHKDADEAKAAKEYLNLHLKLKTEIPATPKETVEATIESKKEVIEAKPNASLTATIEKSKESVKPEDKLNQAPGNKNEEAKPIIKPEDVKPRSNAETIASDNAKRTEDGLQIVNYNYKPEAKHAILFRLNPDIKSSTAKNILDVYHRANYKAKGYKTEILEIASQQLISLGNFKSVQEAIDFYAKMQEDALAQKLISSSTKYYISSENLDILYISSGWEQYQSFYEKNYK
jgi:outer membrane protein assembly factor BamD (BamD/ComL family)